MRCKPYDIDPEDTDRSCGFLTRTDRQYLIHGAWSTDKENPIENRDDAAISTKRSDIQTRTRHTLADFGLVKKYADSELVQGSVHRNKDPAIISESMQKHVQEGLLGFTTTSFFGEEMNEELLEPLATDLLNTEDAEAMRILGGALNGDEYDALKMSYFLMAQKAKREGLSKEVARQAFEEAWDGEEGGSPTPQRFLDGIADL